MKPNLSKYWHFTRLATPSGRQRTIVNIGKFGCFPVVPLWQLFIRNRIICNFIHWQTSSEQANLFKDNPVWIAWGDEERIADNIKVMRDYLI